MNDGKLFEHDWKKSIPDNVYYLRIVDPAMSFGSQDNSTLRFSPSNPYDAIMYIYPNLFLLELKSTKGTSISFKGKTPMIKQKQIDELTKGSLYKGIIPGFIFNYRSKNKTYFLHINDFLRFMNDTTKSSINEKDTINFGAIEVLGEIKRVRYKYYIGEFINSIQDEDIGKQPYSIN